MKRFTFITAAIFCMAFLTESRAATITAVNNGAWTTNSTWSCNCQPTNSDNIVIPAGRTVTMTGSVLLILGPVINITIGGTLTLNGGDALVVDASDVIDILAGGRINSVGGGNVVWSGITPISVPAGTQISGPATINGGTLPITLLFFKGTINGQSVLLEWASASEEGFDYYEIERSADGLSFYSIGRITGAGYSTVRHDYQFVDDNAPEGVSYYRMTAVDIDGSAESFEIVRVEMEPVDDKTVDLFPNPVVGDQVKAKLNFNPGDGLIMVYNSQGFVVAKKSLDTEREYAFALSAGIPKGIYYVVVKTEKGEWRSRLVIE